MIPNTTSLDTYLAFGKFLKKKNIKYKILIIHNNTKKIITKIKTKKNIIINTEPNYYKIYENNFLLKSILLFYYGLKYYCYSKNLLNKYKFDKIITAGDRETPLKLSLLKFAKKKNIKVYNYFPGIIASPKMLLISRKGKKNFYISKNSLTYKIFKNYTFSQKKYNDIKILYYDKIHIYINKFFNILPKNPWIPAGGSSDYFLAENQIIKNHSLKLGCKKKIIVIGSLDQNYIQKSQTQKFKKKAKIAILLTQWFEHNLENLNEHQARNKLLCSLLHKYNLNNKYDVRLYLHPKQKINDYKWVKNYNIKISKKKLAQDFLNIDLILLSFSSSIVAWAIDYKIDIIIANIFREKHPIFHNKNIIYANNLIELNKALSTKLQNIRKKKNICITKNLFEENFLEVLKL